MALNRKYSALPDLDTAPDIYETPDLTDDNSTIPTTAGRSQSENDFDDEDDDTQGISRARLRIDQARSRFMPSQVDARDVDFSDRLNDKRKSYKTSSRRQRVLQDGTEHIGDLSDEEGGEDLERKIARLKREIEEAKEEFGKQKAQLATNAPASEEELASLSRALDEMSSLLEGGAMHRSKAVMNKNADRKDGTPQQAIDSTNGATYTITYAPDYEQSHALAKAADFDKRLLLLEKAIGITASAFPSMDNGGFPRAILPTLDTLQKQIMTLSEASTTSLDSVSRRVRELIQQSEKLEQARRSARAAQDSIAAAGGPPLEAVDSEDLEQIAKVNALYGTLPTIDHLTPLLPPLLDRLRSLRAIHADAATASETIERIEKSQIEMAGDIRQWREGLDKIEGVMADGDAAMNANMKVVEGWVKDLEAKMNQLL
ncbi:uncharacterized protein BCR38DRAFT_176149 [Pseudomassariella vexata]|uniref:Dynamitin-domain-containing protein n=1 Tax=Pseudomassariella vexata TaxID=1141098 RepID=A0A1Y2E4I7_9PEZI|nr:uncharacterized protein BCR38DRAFT_176149 [Pseudomassariella vexata]ORY66264.1 hypothetical protein BCR38DRAFT_176149 [Pseudomassariella vexata]